MDAHTEEVIAKRSAWRWKFYSRIFLGRLRKDFHAVYLLNQPDSKAIKDKQLVCFLNHPSWNDPMVMIYIHNRYLSEYHAYGPIDADAIEGYPFMKKLGLFGVSHGNAGAMRRFLRTAAAVLEQSHPAIMWITPQGRFTDIRERPITFQPGLGGILSRSFDPNKMVIFPAAFEYSFGEEKQPEIMINFGPPVEPPEKNSAANWTEICEQAMCTTQDALAAAVIGRSVSDSGLSLIMGGSTGVGGFYGLWQRLLASIKGEKYNPSHASLTSDSKPTNSSES